MKIKTLITGAYQENCYIIWDKDYKCIVIDPGDNSEEIIKVIKDESLDVIGYVITHAHSDHISALYDVHHRYAAPIAMHSLDWSWAFSEENSSPPFYNSPRKPEKFEYIELESKRRWNFNHLSFTVIHTPGHTPGSCTLYFDTNKIAFVGDTLFKDSCGRTDLPRGNSIHLKESLRLLKKLPSETVIYSGHGDISTIGYEIENNFFMK